MRTLICMLAAFFCLGTVYAQVKITVNQQAELQQSINDLKKEIRDLENDIKETEKTDPAEAASLKKQLSALKNMLAMIDNIGKPSAQSSKTPVTKLPAVKATPSPIVPVIVKQTVVIPTEAQAKDKLLWYTGKKINDSTLVTVKGLLVQYNKNNKNSSLVKIQPPKKSDPFDRIALELTKLEQRKEELAEKFDKMKNGFMFYPDLKIALALYDDLNQRLSEVVKNTIDLPGMLMPVEESGNSSSRTGARGPFLDYFDTDAVQSQNEIYLKGMNETIEQQLALAKKLYNELPPISDFPAPPAHELGMCANCDPELIKKQKKQDSIWFVNYWGKEERILQIVLGVERQRALLGISESDFSSASQVLKRGVEKSRILFEKYGTDLTRSQVVMQVVLGVERQRQLLGFNDTDNFNGMLLVIKGMDVYEKYLYEQMEAKNHDFVLNLGSHLGFLRQKALLGASEERDMDFASLTKRITDYNRFELIMEVDFIMEERDGNNELTFKATGAMATKGKVYGKFVPVDCSYKMIPFNVDLSDTKLQDVYIPFSVKSGVKTLIDENGKLVNYNYSGPESFSLDFPEFKFDFCYNNKPDTAWLLTFMGDSDPGDISEGMKYDVYKNYKSDFLTFANLVFVSRDLQPNAEEFTDLGQDVFKTIGGFQQTNTGSSMVEKLKNQYEGKMKMDEHRKGIQNLVNDKKSMILFTANNRSTVVADQFTDTKRKLEEEGLDLTRGLIHLRLLHSPVQ
ncbi:hypothetical protein ACFSQD_08655 [Flavihumibacter stibioxidans]|nr:hypothetical protein [Flavihumibacter stibioxidans]